MSKLLAAIVVAFFGLGAVSPAAAGTSTAEDFGSVHSYTYELNHAGAWPMRVMTGRGPPMATEDTTQDAGDHRPIGASAGAPSAATPGSNTYDDTATLTQAASGVALAERSGWGASGAFRISNRTGVAAKYGDDLAETAARACSFSGATLVLMADGTKKRIEDVEVGDKVLATDPETREQVAKTVERVFVHDDTLTDLALEDGTVLSTTEDHPYWSVDDQRFERADELAPGEKVLSADGRTVKVSGLRLATTHDGLAYNLAVEGIHTYHVGNDAVLVHNTCDVRGLWQITKEGTAATRQGPYGTLWKSKSDGLWWSRDTAGHGGSAWKVYEESSRGLIWRADANQYGDFIVGKHKSDIGTFIPWKAIN